MDSEVLKFFKGLQADCRIFERVMYHMRDLKLEEGQDSLEEHANGIFFKGRIIENILQPFEFTLRLRRKF